MRHIQIGCQLQEAAAKYQGEGFSCIYVACASTNTQKLVDLLETMFRDLDLEDVNLEQLETKATQVLWEEAHKAEGTSVAAEHGPILADKITHVVVTSLPIPIEIGIPKKSN